MGSGKNGRTSISKAAVLLLVCYEKMICGIDVVEAPEWHQNIKRYRIVNVDKVYK